MTKRELWRALYTAVKAMRALQREYFRRRCPSVLEESKALEKRVDQIIDELPKDTEQKELF